MKYKIVPRRVSLLIYSEEDPVNYIASCQININGTKGTIDTLNGKDFYKFLAQHGISVFESLGLDEIGAAVSPAHLRLLKRILPKEVALEETGGLFEIGSAAVTWIRLTRRKDA